MPKSERKVYIVVFDMDGVLVECESSWEYLHRIFGSISIVRKRNYMGQFEHGLISYEEWMRRDLEAMINAKGGSIHRDDIIRAFSGVKINDEAKDVINHLRSKGVRVAIVSAGIYDLADLIGKKLGIEIIYANKLIYDENGFLLPRGIEVVNPLNKDKVLREISVRFNIPLDKFMYIGDSEWDVSAFRVVGYPVLYLKHKHDLSKERVLNLRRRIKKLVVVGSLRDIMNLIF